MLLVALALFAGWSLGVQALASLERGSASYGLIPIPLWIPQVVMAFDTILFALALLDEFLSLLHNEPAFRRAARTRGERGRLVIDIGLLSLLLVVVLFALLLCGLWIGFALMTVGLVAMEVATGAPTRPVFARRVWGAMISWELVSLPMFIWMGEILFRSRLSSDMFAGLAPLTRRLPGRLLHVNVFGCALFAAVSGSSAATTATIGRMSLPELKARGYDAAMAVGTLAGSGTFGFLIPPSIILIVYGAATEQCIARLFLAGLVPGITLAAMFSG